MEINEHITILGNEAKLFAAAAEQGGWDTAIPTCPGWTMRDLVRHLSEIHLWAAARVAKKTDKLWQDDISESTEAWPDLAVFWPSDEDLADWYLKVNANLVDALESAPADLECPTFLPAPSPLAMWARRQAHETAIHRFDAETAIDATTEYAPAFAADGIDEMLVGFASRKESLPVDDVLRMLVHAEDADDRWHVTMGPDGISAFRGDGPADATLSGLASDIYLVMWNRGDDSSLSVTGDSSTLDRWHNNVHIRWD